MGTNNKHKNNKQPFKVKDCAIITRMGGVYSAVNLRELRERIAVCPLGCLYHHFCETLIRASFDDPEFRNDLAVWAARNLRDRILAERLGILNPYDYANLEELRAKTLEIIDERLSEVHHIPWVPLGEDFRFMQAATVIFDTGVELYSAKDLIKRLPGMSYGSIYYHFVEARRRTKLNIDDFSAWLMGLEKKPEALIQAFARLDFYFLNLRELKEALVEVVRELGKGKTV